MTQFQTPHKNIYLSNTVIYFQWVRWKIISLPYIDMILQH